jgi:Permuted papain-like amidase enzyme, YaeF/YiiX, C92 family
MNKEIFEAGCKLAQTGDLLLFNNKKLLIPKLIDKFGGLDKNTNYKKIHYSHVAIYLGSGQGLIFESSFPKGTQIRPISEYFKDYYTITIKRLENIKVDDISKLKEVIYKRTDLKQGYDWFSFFGLMCAKIFKTKKVDNVFATEKREFCASIVDDVFKEIGFDFFKKLGNKKVVPEDWGALKEFKEIININ